MVKNLPEMQETWVGKIPWRRERLPTPVFRPGEFHGLYSPCGRKELDTTEWLSLSHRLWRPDVKSQLIGKDLNTGKDWRQEEKGATEDKMVGRHHRLNRQKFEQTLGAGERQGSLACCSPWGSQRDRHDWATQQQLHRLTSSSCPTSFYPWTLGMTYFFALARDCWCEFSLLTPLAIPLISNKTESYHAFRKFCQIWRDCVELRHRG